MDVFCLAYIGLVTACILLLTSVVWLAIKSDKIYFNRSKVNQKRINQLKGQRWICVRYVETVDGKDYVRENEIPFSDLMQLILSAVKNEYSDEWNNTNK